MNTQALESGNIIKFGDIAKQCKESVDRSNNPFSRYVEGGHMDSESLRIRRWGEFGDDYVGPAFHRVFKKGQILYGSRRTYLRKISVADFDGITANTTFVIEAKKNSGFDPRLLPFLMMSSRFTRHSITNSKGSTNPYVNWSDIAKFDVYLPSVDRQAEIFKLLDTTEQSIVALEEAISSGEKLLQTLYSNFFSGNFSSNQKNIEKKSTLNEWSYERFDSIGVIKSGGTPRKTNKSYWGGEIPWFSPKDMKSTELSRSIDTLTPEGAAGGSTLVTADTILFVVRGMILAHSFPVGITKTESCFNQDMKALIVDHSFNTKFVLHWMLANRELFLSKVSTSTHGTKKISTDSLKEILVPKPPILIQNQIVEKIEAQEEVLLELKSLIEKKKNIRQKLIDTLIG